mgnify:CR=1 FL=1
MTADVKEQRGRRPAGSRQERMSRVKRVVVKIGSSSVAGTANKLDGRLISRLVNDVVELREGGTEVAIVSSGAVAAGMGRLEIAQRPRSIAELQAKGYNIPNYPQEPTNDEERDFKARYSRVLGRCSPPAPSPAWAPRPRARPLVSPSPRRLVPPRRVVCPGVAVRNARIVGRRRRLRRGAPAGWRVATAAAGPTGRYRLLDAGEVQEDVPAHE